MADYPISNVPRRVQYVNSGVGPYAFTFEILVQTDIAVYRGSTLLTLTTDYSVTINANGTGSITLVTAGTGNITIVGARAIQRSSDYTTGGDLFASTLNTDLDSQTIYSQQLAENLDRTIKIPVTDASTLNMQLPTASSRANKLFGFTASGQPVASTTTVAQLDAAVSSFVNATGNNASSILYTPAGSGALQTTVQAKLRETISVKDFGAVGDFDPTTGVGTDDRLAIQAALDYATSIGNCQVNFPQGQYYLGTSLTVSTSGLAAQLLLGSLTTANAANTIILQGQGAAIYQGSPGTALAIANANNVTVQNLKMVGYAGGTLNSSREFDNLIGIFKSSKFISIIDCYITNSLGYTIYTVGDPNVAGGGTADTCLNITIRNSTLKMRYGSGVTPNGGGSKSLWAFAAVDAQNVVIQDNVIYGNLDFEPNNVPGQSTYGIFVEGNQFPAGYVTPIIPSGPSNYWLDEAIGKSDSGGTAIVGSVSILGATGAPLNACNVVSNNSFDQGIINVGAAVYYQWVLNNSFRLGKINVGDTSGGNTNRFYTINGNTTYEVLDATSAFIVCKGLITNTHFSNNTLTTTDFPVIGTDGVGGADGGTNNYSSNTSPSCGTNPVINFPSFAATSFLSNNTGGFNELVAFTTSLTDGTNSATLAANDLYYKVQGRQITFTTRLFITTPGSIGADSYITLPVPANPQGGMRYVVNVTTEQNFSPSASFTGLYGVILENTDKCFIKQMLSTGIPTGVSNTNFASNAVLIISGSYFTA